MPSIPDIQRELDTWAAAHPKSDLAQLKLEGNQGSIPSSSLDWLRPLPATASDEEIRRELEEKGVVHVKGVMPREMVLEARRKYFETCAPSGVLKPNTDPTDGIFVGGDADPNDFVGIDNAAYIGRSVDDCLYAKLTLDAITSDWAVAFTGNEHLLNMVKRFHPEWSDPFILRRQIFRSNMPSSKGTSTGVHYDQIFLRAAPPTTLTAWVPVGDCTPTNGGLMYLEDSVPLGEEIEERFNKQCAEKGMTEEEKMSAFNENMTIVGGMLSVNSKEFGETEGKGRKWLIGDYEAGDVVFHHAFAIHSSAANRDPAGKIRLSADLRFADRAQPHEVRWDKNRYAPNDGL